MCLLNAVVAWFCLTTWALMYSENSDLTARCLSSGFNRSSDDGPCYSSPPPCALSSRISFCTLNLIEWSIVLLTCCFLAHLITSFLIWLVDSLIMIDQFRLESNLLNCFSSSCAILDATRCFSWSFSASVSWVLSKCLIRFFSLYSSCHAFRLWVVILA